MSWISCTLWATVSDMTNTTSPARTRLVWKTKDIRRTAASLTAYAIIGVAGAAGLWGFVAALAAVGKSMGY